MKIIENELEAVKSKISNNFSDPIPDESLKNFISNGSKMIRSTLAILYIKALEFEITEDIFNIISAGEIIHNASLLHDDVLDEQNLRRNITTIAAKFTPKISILAGDYLITNAIEKLLTINNTSILTIFKDCTKNMSEAEIKQFFLRGAIPSEEEYLEICKKKTASLFSAILKSCAVVLKLSEYDSEKLGELFGICFQIKNDLNEESSKTDKRNGIYTAKDILGIEKTSDLLDNYKGEMSKLLEDIPDNIYKKGLEDLINSL